MAQKVIVTVTDDLNPELEDATTIEFGVDGVAYEIDLADSNAAKLRGSLADFVAKARKVGGKRAGRSKATSATPTGDNIGSKYNAAQRAEIRKWAMTHGSVGERGRLPLAVYEAWEDNRNVSKLPQSALTPVG